MQNLFDCPEIVVEYRQRFGKRFIRRVANALLLQRKRCIQQRTSSRQPLNRLIRGVHVRFDRGAHLFVETRQRIV